MSRHSYDARTNVRAALSDVLENTTLAKLSCCANKQWCQNDAEEEDSEEYQDILFNTVLWNNNKI